MNRILKFIFAALAVLLVASFLIGYASAQEKPAEPATAQAEKQHPEPDALQQSGPSKQLTEASKEASGEDETAEFKRSGSVKWIAKVTGLSVEGAYWLAIAINFIVVAGVIVWALRKSLPKAFRARTVSIQEQMEEARNASAAAQARLSDIESRLARIDQEIASLRAEAEKEAAAEEQHIRAAAEEDRAKIVETSRSEIEAARRQAQAQLKSFAADLAVGLAGRKMTIDPATDRQLVSSFVEELAKEGK